MKRMSLKITPYRIWHKYSFILFIFYIFLNIIRIFIVVYFYLRYKETGIVKYYYY